MKKTALKAFGERLGKRQLFLYRSLCGGKHSYAARVQLEDEALFRVDADTVAGEFPATIQ